jgi:hypothetical protein
LTAAAGHPGFSEVTASPPEAPFSGQCQTVG